MEGIGQLYVSNYTSSAFFTDKKSTYTRKDQKLDFAAMDGFMDFILSTIKEHGSTAVRVFPPASHVLLLFSDRLSTEVVRLCKINSLSTF